MTTFTEQEFIDKMNLLPAELQKKLLLLDYDDDFISIINYNSIKPAETINAIGLAVRLVALGFSSKQELFESVSNEVLVEDEARHIFSEIDRTILVPNNLKGIIETGIELHTEGQEDATNTEDKYSTHNITETAEDILKEIENPTPATSSMVSSFNKQTTTTLTAVGPHDQLSVDGLTNESSNIIKNPQNTATPTDTTPAPNKEGQLEAKLTETVIQPVKSTYYKVDPYREEM
ncbi:MAG: hypothetical protein WCQ00_00960 [bacterium]